MSIDLTKPVRLKGSGDKFFPCLNYRLPNGDRVFQGDVPGIVQPAHGDHAYFSVTNQAYLENIPEKEPPPMIERQLVIGLSESGELTAFPAPDGLVVDLCTPGVKLLTVMRDARGELFFHTFPRDKSRD